jgi:single-strand DNA-binding protein
MSAYAQISGRLGTEPELRFTDAGTPVMNLSIANQRTIKSGEQRETVADWFKVTVFGRDAETLSQFAKKGTALVFNGRLQNEKYTDRDGNQRSSTVLVASSFEFVPTTKRSSDTANETMVSDGKHPSAAIKQDEEDIPF